MKNPRNNESVSQIISEIILLAIAVVSVSLIYMQVLATPGPQDTTHVTIIGKIEEKHPVFELQRGESLGQNSKIYIKINGILQHPFNQSLQELIGNQEWNIGERIIYPENVTGDKTNRPQVETTIVDTKTNAIVFWGILQEGLTTGYKGGIWHLDESYWNGTSKEVKDSSGNNNHGRAINGTTLSSNGKSGNSGYFDGYNDYIDVPSSWTLNITDAITLEAWVKPLQQKSSIMHKTVLEQLKFGYNPDIVHINGNVYAIASHEQQDYCDVITFTILNDGQIRTLDSRIPHNKSTFCSKGDNPDIIRHALNTSLYVIVFENNSGAKGTLCTINISKNGSIKSIGNTARVDTRDEKNFNQSSILNPVIIPITGNIYAIAYRGASGAGVLTTVTIDPTGIISKLNDFSFNNSGCSNPSIIHVSGDVYAIAYKGASTAGVLTTVRVQPSGSISKLTEWTFNISGCAMPSIISVSGDVYALVYSSSSGLGVVTTINISTDGTFISKIRDLKFADVCYEPKITRTTGNLFGIIYNTKESGDANGFLKTVTIEPNGYISDTSLSWEPEQLDVQTPIKFFEPSDILLIDGRIFAVAYRDGAVQHGHPGFIITLRLGEDPTPKWKRGVVRAGAATIYAEYPRDKTMVNVLACLNGTEGPGIIIITNVTPDVWHHIALTYDGSIMRVFIDGNTTTQLTRSLSGELRIPNEHFRFGNVFYGYLDEIAIYGKALPQARIQHHVQNPGNLAYDLLQ